MPDRGSWGIDSSVMKPIGVDPRVAPFCEGKFHVGGRGSELLRRRPVVPDSSSSSTGDLMET